MMQKLKHTFTSCFSPGILKHLTVGHIWNWSKTKIYTFSKVNLQGLRCFQSRLWMPSPGPSLPPSPLLPSSSSMCKSAQTVAWDVGPMQRAPSRSQSVSDTLLQVGAFKRKLKSPSSLSSPVSMWHKRFSWTPHIKQNQWAESEQQNRWDLI